MTQSSIVCGLPFCQSTQGKQTNRSIRNRVTAIVLGIIAVLMASMIVLNVPGLGHLGTTAGWAMFSAGTFIALAGASIKCIKKPQGLPLVVLALTGDRKVSEEEFTQFRALKKDSTVWVGVDKKESIIGQCIGHGGSKRAMKISEDQVLMLPNERGEFDSWQRIVEEEVQISDKLTSLGILTVQSKRVGIFLSKESAQPLPAYICPSFESLAKEGMYVIDGKNRDSTCWKGKSYFKGKENRYAIESWLPIITPLLQDIYTLAKHSCLFGRDAFNIVIIKNDQGEYRARYFGFDFSSKTSACNRVDELREDVMDEVVNWLPDALEKVFWEQYDFDTQKENMFLGDQYRHLIKEFQKHCPEILL